MTKANFDRANEIRSELYELKKSLTQVSRTKFFELSSLCTADIRTDSFLSEIENDLKTYANAKILERINVLEDEFKSL